MRRSKLGALAATGLGFVLVGCVASPDPRRPPLELIDSGLTTSEASPPPMLDGLLAPPLQESGVPPATGKSCKEVDACQMGCKDTACMDACLNQGSATAQTQINELDACAKKAKAACNGVSSAAWNACVGTACPTEFAACFGEQAGGSGPATCLQIISCVNTCDPTDSLALARCIWRGTAPAQSAYFSWNKCSIAAANNQCLSVCKAGQSADCSECLGYYCAAQASGCKST